MPHINPTTPICRGTDKFFQPSPPCRGSDKFFQAGPPVPWHRHGLGTKKRGSRSSDE
ncbi:MAG: hypothetical protein IKW97_00920 [Muribaculaceae bacterium]|nr:hypothetical protein [Muribaculaceae bacterium]